MKAARRGLALCLSLAAGCSCGTLPPGAFALHGVDPNSPVDDLAPLAGIVGDAQFVGLGESIHTSGGYYAAKNRLVRYFVEQLGFRALAMETPRTNAEVASLYIERGIGTLNDSMKSIFPVFACPETAELFAWLADFNQAHPNDPVYFYGFDGQQPEADAEILEAFLSQVDPVQGAALWSAVSGNCSLATLDISLARSNAPYPGTFAGCTAALGALESAFGQNQAAWTAQSSSDAYARASMGLISLQGWQGEVDLVNTSFAEANAPRDQSMAQLLLAMHQLRSPAARTVVWAHNLHLSESPVGLGGVYSNMGSHLATTLGSGYLAIALLGFDVGINWDSVGYGSTGLPSGSTSLEIKLHGLGRPALLIDSHSAWLGNGQTYALDWPSGNSPSLEVSAIPSDVYRAFVFLDQSPPMNALFWAPAADGGWTTSSEAVGIPSTLNTVGPTPSMDGGPCARRTDGCQALGLACQPDSLNLASGTGICGLPQPGEACAASAGCALGSVCLGNSDGGVCRQSCSSTSDCLSPWNGCVLDPSTGVPACEPIACVLTAAAPCAMGDAGFPGACVAGFCLAAGSAPNAGPCLPFRIDGGTSQLCTQGSECAAALLGPSTCEPLCTLSLGQDAGNCASGAVCIPAGVAYGHCRPPCQLDSDCTGGLRCRPYALLTGTLQRACGI